LTKKLNVALLAVVAGWPVVAIVIVRLAHEANLPACASPIQWHNAAHLTRGMSKQQVTALLGCPDGDYSRTTWTAHFIYSGPPRTKWEDDTGEIIIWFLGDGRAGAIRFGQRVPRKH
jgi:hypothetical protein